MTRQQASGMAAVAERVSELEDAGDDQVHAVRAAVRTALERNGRLSAVVRAAQMAERASDGADPEAALRFLAAAGRELALLASELGALARLEVRP